MGKINFCGHIWDIFSSSSRNTCQQILYLPIRQSCQLDSNPAWIWNTNHNYQKDNYNNQKDNYNNNAHNYNYQKDNYNNKTYHYNDKTYYYNNKTNNYINKKDNYNNRKDHYNYTLLQPHNTY